MKLGGNKDVQGFIWVLFIYRRAFSPPERISPSSKPSRLEAFQVVESKGANDLYIDFSVVTLAAAQSFHALMPHSVQASVLAGMAPTRA